MRLVRNRLARRFKGLGLISDLALLGAAARRVARGSGGKLSPTEMAMAGGATLRLLQRLRRRRKTRKAAKAARALAD